MRDKEYIDSFRLFGRKRELAVQDFIESHSYFVPKIQRKLGLSKEDALDCYSDSIVSVVKQVSDDIFRGESKLSSYLYRIFYNKCVDLSRKSSSNVNVTDDFSNISTGTSIQNEIEIEQDFIRLTRQIAVLGEKCKMILLDWGYFGYSMAEIAERNELPSAKQAKDTKYKCLKKLRELLNVNTHDSK